MPDDSVRYFPSRSRTRRHGEKHMADVPVRLSCGRQGWKACRKSAIAGTGRFPVLDMARTDAETGG